MHTIKRLIPNLLTAGNLVGGIMAIILTLTGKIELAPYCIFASAIFDFLDGFVARLLNVQSELGKQLDSLADMVTFGVAPGVMMFVILCVNFDYNTNHFMIGKLSNAYLAGVGVEVSSFSHKYFLDWLPFLSFLIPVFALFRLAKFNLDTRQSDSFIGLPTPAMTLFLRFSPF